MPATHYDVVVIGCGPAGQQAATRCAQAGRRVALVDERELVGGRCLHLGTIPSKTLRAAILHASGYYERAIYGDQHRGTGATHAELMRRLRSVVSREITVIHDQLTRAGVQPVQGRGRFLDPHRLEVTSSTDRRVLRAQHVVLATGTRSVVDPAIPIDGYHLVSTDQVLQLPFLPRTLVLVGGGVVALEYACMFGLLDIDVHLVTSHRQLLPWVDRELVSALLSHMQQHGVSLHLGRSIRDVRVTQARRVSTTLDDGLLLESQMLMYAGRRWGATQDLGLDALGLQTIDRDLLQVDDRYRTAQPHVYAVGDVIGWPSLAATAIDQGRKAANHLVGLEDVPYNPLFPYGIYTVPDLSMVGASEQDLRGRNEEYAVGIGHYRDSARGQILGDQQGMVKLLFHPTTRRLLGVHIFGVEATELVHLGQAVMLHQGTIDYFADTVFNYPTLAEVYKRAAVDGLLRLGAMEPGTPLFGAPGGQGGCSQP